MSESDSTRTDRGRRTFLKTAAGTAALGLAGRVGDAIAGEAAKLAAPAAATKVTIPRRVLGKTGLEVSLLGFGGGSRFLMASEDESLAMLERAVALGINYFDTAASYGRERKSERLYGRGLPRHRKSIVLATKTDERGYDGAMRSVETSLKLLNTDVIDVVQIHSAGPKDELAAWEKPTGVVTALRKLRDQKVVRFIGFTGHEDGATHKKVIETIDFDTVLMALNAAQHKAFVELALPAAHARGMGIIGMKVCRDLAGGGAARGPVKDLLAYVWDKPVATTIVGMENLGMLEENAKLAGAYVPGAPEPKRTAARLSAEVPLGQLCWAQPGYVDRCV